MKTKKCYETHKNCNGQSCNYDKTDPRTVASVTTTQPTHHTLENGRVIELPAGLPVERATNLPDRDNLFWISDIPKDMLSNATIESHFRNIGFLVHENFTTAY